MNVDSGSVIAEPLSIDDSYDFHLAAQYVTQGTCTPTLFRVAYDTTKMPQEALITFTFEQCFNYYNWEGAVRVPACLQCADKLSKLVSMSIKANIETSDLTKKHFFLWSISSTLLTIDYYIKTHWKNEWKTVAWYKYQV